MPVTWTNWCRPCGTAAIVPARFLLYGPDPAGQLVGYLRKDPVDLLVVGSHGHGLVRDLLFGQTVDRVRHNLNVPMLIARPGRESTPSSGSTARASAPVSALTELDRSWDSRDPDEEIAE